MKLDVVKLGTRAEKSVTFAIRGVDQLFAVRPLDGAEFAATLRFAREYAKSEGVEEPKPGEPLYELGLALKTIELGCVDVDSTPRSSFFSGGTKEIVDVLGREEIAFLYEVQELWQSECSPISSRMSGSQMLSALVKIVEAEPEDDRFFLECSPAIRKSLLRTTGALVLSSPELRSVFGSPFATTPKSGAPLTQ